MRCLAQVLEPLDAALQQSLLVRWTKDTRIVLPVEGPLALASSSARHSWFCKSAWMWYITTLLICKSVMISSKADALDFSPARRRLAMTASAVFPAFAASRLLPEAAMMKPNKRVWLSPKIALSILDLAWLESILATFWCHILIPFPSHQMIFTWPA